MTLRSYRPASTSPHVELITFSTARAKVGITVGSRRTAGSSPLAGGLAIVERFGDRASARVTYG